MADETVHYVVTRGFGDFAVPTDVKFLPTRGFLSSDEGAGGGGILIGPNPLIGV